MHANKEVLLIQSTNATFDTGDIFEVIKRTATARFTFNIISLNAKIQVFRVRRSYKQFEGNIIN
jgi:hypothetical protein